MTSAILVVALVVGVRAQDQRDGATVPAPAQQRQTTLLESATTLVMSTPQPTFHVDVDARFPRQTPLDALREELAADRGMNARAVANTGGSPALVQIDLLPTINGVFRTISRARRMRAQENARREVTEEMALFCRMNDCPHVEQTPIEGVIVPDRIGAR